MWLIFALASFIFWGAADLFYKRSNENSEKYTHLKTSVVVGLVMGIHAIATLIIQSVSFQWINLILYLPVSLMYIMSMTVGYFGLRFLELSISSPIQNASGAVTCILLMVYLHEMPNSVNLVAVLLISAGVFWLGWIEHKQNLLETSSFQKQHRFGFVAVMIPVFYCVLDSLGTFLDGLYLNNAETTPLRGVTEENLETVANCSYELTFLIIALILMIYVYVIRHEPLRSSGNGSRLAAALFETAGQFTYVYAMSGNAVIAAPVIASYCICSILLARVFLKEKLTCPQWLAVILVILGIVILGIAEGLSQ